MAVFEVDVLKPKYSDRVTFEPPLIGGNVFDPNPTFETMTVTDHIVSNQIDTASGPLTINAQNGVIYTNGLSTELRVPNIDTEAKLVVSGRTSFRPEYNASNDYSWDLAPSEGYPRPSYIQDVGMFFEQLGHGYARWKMGVLVDTDPNMFTMKFKINTKILGDVPPTTALMMMELVSVDPGNILGLIIRNHGVISFFLTINGVAANVDMYTPAFAEDTTHEILYQFTDIGASFIAKLCIDGVQVYRGTTAHVTAEKRHISDIFEISSYGVNDPGLVKISDLEFFDSNLVNPNDDSGYTTTPFNGVSRTVLPPIGTYDRAETSNGYLIQDDSLGLVLSSETGRITVNNPLFFDTMVSSSASGLDAYTVQSVTPNPTFFGAFQTAGPSTADFSCRTLRIGKLVILQWYEVNPTHVSLPAYNVSQAAPLGVDTLNATKGMRPAWNTAGTIWVWHTVKSNSVLVVDTDGYITIYPESGVLNWTIGQPITLGAGAMSWLMA